MIAPALRLEVALRVEHQLRDAEVEDLHEVGIVFARDEEDVVGLEIAMHDAARVRRTERSTDATRNVDRSYEREATLLRERIREAAPGEPLHDDVVTAVLELSEVEDVDDVIVLDVARGARLVEEARDECRIPTEVREEHLDRHAPRDLRMLGQVDGAHAALADLLRDDVVVDRAPDHPFLIFNTPWRGQRRPSLRDKIGARPCAAIGSGSSSCSFSVHSGRPAPTS